VASASRAVEASDSNRVILLATGLVLLAWFSLGFVRALVLAYALAWGLSTLTGALAGMLISLDSGLTGGMVIIGLKAFPAALVGGLDSLVGAIVGALIIGLCEVLAIQYIDPLLSDVIPFVVLIAFLIVRPWGLFGTREELDRV